LPIKNEQRLSWKETLDADSDTAIPQKLQQTYIHPNPIVAYSVSHNYEPWRALNEA
jgi:hypothetical protein